MLFSGLFSFSEASVTCSFSGPFQHVLFFRIFVLDTFPLLAVRFFGVLLVFLCCLHFFSYIFIFVWFSVVVFLAFSALCFFFSPVFSLSATFFRS